MQEQSIINVLSHMRLEALRSDLAGLEHIEALMRLRGFDPASQPIAQHRPRKFKRGHLNRAILNALRDGPKTGPEVIKHIARAENMIHAGLRMSVYNCLNRGLQKGHWVHDNWIWGLNP